MEGLKQRWKVGWFFTDKCCYVVLAAAAGCYLSWAQQIPPPKKYIPGGSGIPRENKVMAYASLASRTINESQQWGKEDFILFILTSIEAQRNIWKEQEVKEVDVASSI